MSATKQTAYFDCKSAGANGTHNGVRFAGEATDQITAMMAMTVSITEATCKDMVTTMSVKEDMRRIMAVRLPPGHSGLTAIFQQTTTILGHPLILAFTSSLTPPHVIAML